MKMTCEKVPVEDGHLVMVDVKLDSKDCLKFTYDSRCIDVFDDFYEVKGKDGINLAQANIYLLCAHVDEGTSAFFIQRRDEGKMFDDFLAYNHENGDFHVDSRYRSHLGHEVRSNGDYDNPEIDLPALFKRVPDSFFEGNALSRYAHSEMFWNTRGSDVNILMERLQNSDILPAVFSFLSEDQQSSLGDEYISTVIQNEPEVFFHLKDSSEDQQLLRKQFVSFVNAIYANLKGYDPDLIDGYQTESVRRGLNLLYETRNLCGEGEIDDTFLNTFNEQDPNGDYALLVSRFGLIDLPKENLILKKGASENSPEMK